MKHSQDRLDELLSRHLQGELTGADQQEFWSYVQNPLFESSIKQRLSERFDREDGLSALDKNQQRTVLGQIFRKGKRRKTVPTRVRRITRRPAIIAAAALLLCTFSLGLYLYLHQQSPNSQLTNVAQDIDGGQHSATLTLSDGSQIALTGHFTGTIAEEAGIGITLSEDGALLYEIHATAGATADRWNTLATKNAETYRVKLPDGTTAWLNAGSALSYPVAFAPSGQRRVKLEGEAYFDVAHDRARPFLVETKGQPVEVLGTEFNLTAYANETAVTTTLIEGRVRVADVTLQPGEQTIEQNGEIRVQTAADLEAISSWKDGYFKFNENLESILTKIARWYDIDVEYQYHPPAHLTFSGKISRDKPLSDLLKILAYNDEVQFEIRGRRLMVMK